VIIQSLQGILLGEVVCESEPCHVSLAAEPLVVKCQVLYSIVSSIRSDFIILRTTFFLTVGL